MTPAISDFKRRKRNILALLAVAIIVTNIASTITRLIVAEVWSNIPLLLAIVSLGIGILAWCKVDAEELEKPLGGGWKGMLFLFGAFALVAYLFSFRGFKHGLKGLGWALIYWFITFAVSFLLSMMVFMALLLSGNANLPVLKQ
ncbi:MAG: hypothetical protein QM785_15270 [Pyrinomonadaceae bacterium]